MELSETEYAEFPDPVLRAQLRIALELEMVSPEDLLLAIRARIDERGMKRDKDALDAIAAPIADFERRARKLIAQLERDHQDDFKQALLDLERASRERYLNAADARAVRSLRDMWDSLRENVEYRRRRYPGSWQEDEVKEEICWLEDHQNALQCAKKAIPFF
jgi:hypothetical protein